MGAVTDAVNFGTPTYQTRCNDFKNVLTYFKTHGGYNIDLSAVHCGPGKRADHGLQS
jgi:hypothetical protein